MRKRTDIFDKEVTEAINAILKDQRLPMLDTLKFLLLYTRGDAREKGVEHPYFSPDIFEEERIWLLRGAEELQPYRYSFPNSTGESYNIAYTVYGDTEMEYADRKIMRTTGCLAFTDNRLHHTNRVVSQQGTQILYLTIQGLRVKSYFDAFQAGGSETIILPKDSEIPRLMREIITIQKEEMTFLSLMTSCKITELLCKMLQAKEKRTERVNAPLYIRELQQTFFHQYMQPVNLETFAKKYAVNKYKLIKDFHQYTGSSPIEYLIDRRVQVACDLLIHSEMSIKEILYQTGFSSSGNFINQFKKRVGMTPSEYRKS